MSLSDLFAGLTLDAIEAFVAESQDEHLSLEFKTVNTPAITSGSDKRNLATALSGFANSAGGIVIWGIGTKKESGVDVAATRSPILELPTFVARLQEFTALYVTPTVHGVAHQHSRFPMAAALGPHTFQRATPGLTWRWPV